VLMKDDGESGESLCSSVRINHHCQILRQ
jgi:hypothetical protein